MEVKKFKSFRVLSLIDDHEDEFLLENGCDIRASRDKFTKSPDFQILINLFSGSQLFHFIDENSVLRIYCFGKMSFEKSGKSKN